jgi:hypothetical protein
MVPETGKRRRSRIDLDYYRAPDAMSRWRGRLCLFAIVVGGGWVGFDAIASRAHAPYGLPLEPSRLASKGPLARPHAMWDSTCSACHIPFTPVSGSRWVPSPWTGSRASDAKCRTCHAGPAHHESERKRDVPACAECHRDHRGPDASLLAIADSACTACHGDLSAHRERGAESLSVAPAVTRFDREHHPDFTASMAARAVDPRRIKFSHARHLAAGLALEQGGAPFTFAEVAFASLARYGWTSKEPLNRPVRLTCAACHQLDGEDSVGEVDHRPAHRLPPRTGRAYMQPIAYEKHCIACHPLHFDAEVPTHQVRHGLSPDQVRIELREYYAAAAVASDPALLRQFVPTPPFPGQSSEPAKMLVEDAIEKKVKTAEKILFASGVDEKDRRQENLPLGRRGCVECHSLKATTLPLKPAGSPSLPEIEPVLMTPVWFKSASFDHTAHRALECAGCHTGMPESRENGDRQLIPGIDNCLKCHAPAGTRTASFRGGASAACTTCHRYHNGDHPAEGPGAQARRGSAELSLERFLSGGSASGEK